MHPKPTRYGLVSCTLFGVAAALFMVTSVVLDQALAALPLSTQRGIGFLALVLPAALGVVLALIGVLHSRENRIAAIVGLLLNALFGAFFALVLLLGG